MVWSVWKKGRVAENLFPLLVQRWTIRQQITHMVKIVKKEKTKDSENDIGVSWHEQLFWKRSTFYTSSVKTIPCNISKSLRFFNNNIWKRDLFELRRQCWWFYFRLWLCYGPNTWKEICSSQLKVPTYFIAKSRKQQLAITPTSRSCTSEI